MTEDIIERSELNSRRHSRDVTYWSGKWVQLSSLIPKFELADFRAADSEPANPHLKAVVRLPLKPFERKIPVGIVSNSYPLAQHEQVAEQCFLGIHSLGVKPDELKCDVGLTDLGEWMNLRIYFPEAYDFRRTRDDRLGLRLECFNYDANTHTLTAGHYALKLYLSDGYDPYWFRMETGLPRNAAQIFAPGFEPEYKPTRWTFAAQMDDEGFYWECDGRRYSNDKVVEQGIEALAELLMK